MLNAKNGVITEDRFQRLTEVQWLFHYLEVTKYKNQETKDKIDFANSLIEAVDNRLKVVLDVVHESNKLAGMISNPEAGKAIIEQEQLEADKMAIKDDEFAEMWEDFSQYIPRDLVVTAMGDNVDVEGGGIDLERMNEYYADMIEKELMSTSDKKGGEANEG